jgi:uncharacterized membrane protein YqjE
MEGDEMKERTENAIILAGKIAEWMFYIAAILGVVGAFVLVIIAVPILGITVSVFVLGAVFFIWRDDIEQRRLEETYREFMRDRRLP